MMAEDWAEPMHERMAEAAPRRRKRVLASVNIWTMQRLAVIAVISAVAIGVVFGDIWLWRLLYGG